MHLTRPARFASLEIGRFVAAAAVVLFHVNVTTMQAKYFGYQAIPFWAGGFGGVEFFFVLSGFVMAIAHHRDFMNGGGYLRFLKKRFLRLYPAIWLILLILVPAMAFLPALRWEGSIGAGDVVAAFAISPVASERILAVEWSLRYEIVFYAIFALALAHRRLGSSVFALWLVAALASYAFHLDGIAGFLVAPYPLLFLAGILIAAAYLTGKTIGPVLPIGIGVITLGAEFHHCAIQPFKPGTTPFDTSAFGIGSAVLVYGLVCLEARRPLQPPRWLMTLGAASYSIYLVHFMVVSICTKAAMKLRGVLPDPLLMIGIAALAIAAGLIYHLVVEKPLTDALQCAFLRKAPAAGVEISGAFHEHLL